MDSSVVRKRNVEKVVFNNILPLAENFIILLKNRKESKYANSRISLCLRLCLLSELYIKDIIYISNGVVVPRNCTVENSLLKLIYERLFRTSYTPVELLLALNGETRDSCIHVKQVRRYLYKELESMNILKRKNYKMLYYIITITDHNIYQTMLNELINYLLSNTPSDTRMDVLICCIVYCDYVENILVNLTESKAKIVDEKIKKITKMYVTIRNEDSIVEHLLSYLLCIRSL